MGEWKVVKEATEEEEGLKERVCTREGCTYKETEAIPKLNPQPGEGGSDTGDGDHTNTGDGGNTNTGNGGNTNTGNGGNTSAGGQGQGAVQTGDTTSLTIWMLLLGASCTMLVLRKKESDNI